MRTLSTLILLLAWPGIFTLYGQAPHAFSYQAVARNATGQIIANQNINLKISILTGSVNGTPVYIETHDTTTNQFGLINLEIGNGAKISGDFAIIDWGSYSYFLKVEIDETGGTDYKHMGTTQLLSVPYALFAKEAGNVDDADPDPQNELINSIILDGTTLKIVDAREKTVDLSPLVNDKDADTTNELQTLILDGDSLKISKGNAIYLAGTVDLDADPTNELQILSISNDTIYLSDGGLVKLPEGFSGSFNDLSNVPSKLDTDTTDDFNGDYNNLTNRPNLALKLDTVETINWDKNSSDDFSGNYNNLSNLPDWSDTVDVHVPDLSGYATKNMNSENITNLADPVNLQDATTKAYVDILLSRIEVLEFETGIKMKDIDGNIYKTVKIGNQVWMAENFKTTMYNDNTAIPLVTDNTAWGNLTTPGYCWYGNDASTYKADYGALYNWYAINTGKLCPAGWHVPSDAEWTVLTDYLGGESVAGGKMKETGTSHWLSPNTGATNESGFTALPGGLRDEDGAFFLVGNHGDLWSSTDGAFYRNVRYDYSDVRKFSDFKEIGFSVRCIEGEAKVIPTLTTTTVTSIKATNASSGGNITDDGGASVTSRGVCWSTNLNPTIADSKTTDGTGIGSFTSSLTGLTGNTNYNLRAYATNSEGTAYGNELNFTTSAPCTSFVVIHTAGDVAPVSKTVNYGTVETNLSGENKCWITQNLGADSQANSTTDASEEAAGWYWQFNRKQGYKHDGSTRTPGTAWITTIDEANDWTIAEDPCKILLGTGWRIPTFSEWSAADINGSWTNYNDTYASVLKLHTAGFLGDTGGWLGGRGSGGNYWSSTQNGNALGWRLFLDSSRSFMDDDDKSDGFSIRCIKD